MDKPRFYGFFTILILLFLVSSLNASADELGTCTNPGAGVNICRENRLVSMDTECCPTPESQNKAYYKSESNPTGPEDHNDCVANFFFSNQEPEQVNECQLGCCCTQLTKDVKTGAQCKGSGETFHAGDTDCSECTLPQCNDGVDNDGNGCADLQDSGCASQSDNSEAGGVCFTPGLGCQSISYIPQLTGFRAIPVKGERKISLTWNDECSQNAVSYEISRCKGANCQNLNLIATTNTNSFLDSSNELLFDNTYTYQIKAFYSLQTATPTKTVVGQLGNLECSNRFDNNNFCIQPSYYNQYKDYLITNDNRFTQEKFLTKVNEVFSNRLNKAFFCDNDNILQGKNIEGQNTNQCSQNQVCVVTNNEPKCLEQSACNYAEANPFGLYYQQTVCENDNYCFFDRSFSIANNCYACSTTMSCYDYKSEETCGRDNCGISNCEWRSISDELGTGVCINEFKDNCEWCNKAGSEGIESSKAFSSVFEVCSEEKAEKLSVNNFQCYFKDGMALSCKDVTCLDYPADECSSSNIVHDQFNKITNPSNDHCGINICQKFGNQCKKNADGNNEADCNDVSCERDYSAPNTTITPLIDRGIYKRLGVQIFDRSGKNATATRRTGNDYKTYLCLEPCGQNGHPYDKFTNGYSLIITNLKLFDGNNGQQLLEFSEGANTVRYYSQDPSKNIGLVKIVNVEAHGDTDGPRIFSVNITGATKVNDVYYTNNLRPKITVEFFESASITHAVIKSETGFQTTPSYNSGSSKKFEFTFAQDFEQGNYKFEINAKNEKNIFMDETEIIEIVLDDAAPSVTIMPAEGQVLNKSEVEFKLEFNKGVNLEGITITDNRNITNILGGFTTEDNKVFSAKVPLSDGNKEIKVIAKDFAGNGIISTSGFIVNARPLSISLLEPTFGVSSNYTFDVVVLTDNNASCRYSFDDDQLEYEFMDPFDVSLGVIHRINFFNKIRVNDKAGHILKVACMDAIYGLGDKVFTLRVDTEPPIIKEAFTNPNPVIEIPRLTVLTLNTDKPTICKFSQEKRNFNQMESKFPGFDENSYRAVHKNNITKDDEGTFTYFVACRAENELKSDTKEIRFEVNTRLSLKITSHTQEFSDTTDIVLAVETNKLSQCKFSSHDPSVTSGTIFGAPSYSHTRSLKANVGKNTYYVICKDQFLQEWSDPLRIDVTVDATAPVMQLVDDSSTLENNTEFTWRTSQLRVKMLGRDNETRVSSYLYTLEEFGTLNTIVNWTASFIENEWFWVKDLNLTNGAKYFFRAKAKNIVGLESDAKDSNGITINIDLKPTDCSNGVKDPQESDIDCGGPCDQCSEGKVCRESIDCSSGFCNDNKVCAAPTCNDNIKQVLHGESDIDCGGNNCNKCENGKTCNVNSDCSSGFCSFGICKESETCRDGKISGTESDTDCGGACPDKCSEGQHCDGDNDCTSGTRCFEAVCKVCAEDDLNCNGIPDYEENCDRDTDGDGMDDCYEIEHGLDPNDPNDALLDPDNDGITNRQEYTYRTNPNKADTDADGYSDKKEIDRGTDPLDPESRPSSRLGFILFLIFLIILLIAGSYFAYVYYEKRKEKEKPAVRPMPKPLMPKPKARGPAPELLRQTRMKEMLKKREEEKKAKRAKLFEAFGAKKPEVEKPKEKKPESVKKSEEKKPKKADVFTELKSAISKKPVKEHREITKIRKQVEKLPSKEKEDVMKNLMELAEKTRKGKMKGDVFIELKKIIRERKRKKKR